MMMQSTIRFRELEKICFIKENYTHPLQAELSVFSNENNKVETFGDFVTRDTMQILPFNSILETDKERIEKCIGTIKTDETKDKSVLYFSNQLFTTGANWVYLHEINNDSIVVYQLVSRHFDIEYWNKRKVSLVFKKEEIAYCMIKKLANCFKDNKQFSLEYNSYLKESDCTEEEFIDFLNYTTGRVFVHNGLSSATIQELPCYEELRSKLFEKKNNLIPHTEIVNNQDSDYVEESINKIKSDIKESPNPNYGKGWIERDGKYYLKLKDGEIERSLEEIKKNASAMQNIQERNEIATSRYAKILELPMDDIPEYFDSIVEIDWFVDFLMKHYKEKKETYGTENIITQIQMFIDIQNESISNPLLKESRETDIYFKARLESLLNIWSKYTKTDTHVQKEESKSIDNENVDDIVSSIKLSHFEIALLYHYLGVKINHGSNAIKVAKKYQQGSGEELMKQVEWIEGSPLVITEHKFTKRYHESIINQGLLDSCPVGKEKAENALRRIKMRK